jgi:hypothetical protein
MNTTRYRKTLIAATLSLAVGGLATTATAGTSTKIDLDEAVDDYSDVYTGGSMEQFTTASRDRGPGYRVDIDLDEAYHDYQGHEVQAYERALGELHVGELAALEFSSSLPVELPWELRVVD